MHSIEIKIKNAIKPNKFNPTILGERKWYSYFIRVTELVWVKNYHDGYKIEVYEDDSKINHLTI